MPLFNISSVNVPRVFSLKTEAAPGLFYDLEEGFILPLVRLEKNAKVELETTLKLPCMFSVSTLKSNGERCGFFFTSRFAKMNKGGFIVTYLQRMELATEVDVLIKNDDLILYHFPNRGSLAVSPSVSHDVTTIFEEQ